MASLQVAHATTVAPTSAPACITATLDYYRNNYTDGFGCTIGPLTFYSFNYSKVSDYGDITDDDILVTPDPLANNLLFSGVNATTFNHTIATGQREQYLLTYVIDPPPIVAGDDLTLDPPTGPIYVSRWTCTDQPFLQSPGAESLRDVDLSVYGTVFKCRDGSDPYYIQVSPLTQLTDNVIFRTPAAYVFARMMFDLLPGEVRGLDGIIAQSQTIPELGTLAPAAAALAGLLYWRRRRQR